MNVPVGHFLPAEELHRFGQFDFVLLDRRATSLEEMESLSSYGCLIGLDEGGPGRSYMPYLIDCLPSGKKTAQPNLTGLQNMQILSYHLKILNLEILLYKLEVFDLNYC